MIKFKKIMTVCLTSLALASVAIPSTLLATQNVAYAQNVTFDQKYPRGTRLEFTQSKTATTVGTWYTEANFEKTLKIDSGNGCTFSYHFTGVTYRKTGAYWTTDAHYAID